MRRPLTRPSGTARRSCREPSRGDPQTGSGVPHAACRGGLGDECGSATVWGCLVLAVLCVVGSVPVAVAAVLHARHRAAAAADLAAVAAAHWVLIDPDAACRAAARIATAHDAQLVACAPDASGLAVTVAVSVALPGPLGRFGAATGQARAGPVTAPDLPCAAAPSAPAAAGAGGARAPPGAPLNH